MGHGMRRAGLFFLLVLGVGSAQASDVWSSLWRTPDQRGEQLLRQGNAAAAAHTFADPQRKAYAELKAGDYPAAARDFAPFKDSDAQYNRGNALARAGDLPAALKAYDAALARDPNNRDARHNRDLVAQALKQSKPPAASKPKQNGKQNPGKGSNKGADQSSGKGSGKGEDKGADQGSNKGAGSSGQKPGEKPGAKPGQQQQAGKSGSKPGQQGQGSAPAEREKPANPASAGNGPPRPQPANANDAEQARRDAEAGLAQQAQQQAGAGQGDLAGKALRPGQANVPRSEQQLAQEQWLRQIPDDPGGLLRRKFLIEHLMRQQGNQP
jgi:Ca-activated chloride channel family protein